MRMSEPPRTLPTPGGWSLYGEALQSRLTLRARLPMRTLIVEAGAMSESETAHPSTPVVGTPF